MGQTARVVQDNLTAEMLTVGGNNYNFEIRVLGHSNSLWVGTNDAQVADEFEATLRFALFSTKPFMLSAAGQDRSVWHVPVHVVTGYRRTSRPYLGVLMISEVREAISPLV